MQNAKGKMQNAKGKRRNAAARSGLLQRDGWLNEAGHGRVLRHTGRAARAERAMRAERRKNA
jgi:hypothetical protein